jgi:hypothetical protein
MTFHRILLTGAFATVAIGAAAPAFGQQEPVNLLAAGGFEFEGLSLRLPEVSPFPLVVGGWGSRADDASAATATGQFGQQTLTIFSDATHPAHVIQDAPLGTAGFVFRAAIQRDSGRQSIALHGDWDRMDPSADALVRVDLRAATIRVTTAAGSWSVPLRLDDGVWHEIDLQSDPRADQVSLRIDGVLQGSFPGAPATTPRTVILGGQRGATRSAFRYDDLVLLRLPEIELLALREGLAESGQHAAIQRRLDVAHQALLAGSSRMMAAELRAVARLLDAAADPATGARLDALIALAAAR